MRYRPTRSGYGVGFAIPTCRNRTSSTSSPASLFPVAMQIQRIYGLTAYLPAVLPADKAPGLPDEIALVFYPSQAAYRATKDYPGGRAYSDLTHRFLPGQEPQQIPGLLRRCGGTGNALPSAQQLRRLADLCGGTMGGARAAGKSATNSTWRS